MAITNVLAMWNSKILQLVVIVVNLTKNLSADYVVYVYASTAQRRLEQKWKLNYHTHYYTTDRRVPSIGTQFSDPYNPYYVYTAFKGAEYKNLIG